MPDLIDEELVMLKKITPAQIGQLYEEKFGSSKKKSVPHSEDVSNEIDSEFEEGKAGERKKRGREQKKPGKQEEEEIVSDKEVSEDKDKDKQ